MSIIPDLPNYSNIPNYYIDSLMKELTPAEFKVLMLIARKTFGYHKRSDRISISQFQEFTGLSNRGIINSYKSLQEKGIIDIKEGGSGMNIYTPIISDTCELSSVGSELSSKSGELSSHTKEILQKKDTKESDDIDYKYYIDLWNELNDTKIIVTESKKKSIRGRLRRYSKEQIVKAMKNRANCEWIKANRDSQAIKFDALFRNDEKMEHWLYRNPKNTSLDDDRIAMGIF